MAKDAGSFGAAISLDGLGLVTNEIEGGSADSDLVNGSPARSAAFSEVMSSVS